MTIERPLRIALIVAAAAFAIVLRAAPAVAVDTDEPAAPASTKKKDGEVKSKGKAATPDKSKDKPGETKSDKKSERQFLDGYRHAHDLIYRQHQYAAAIAALRALGHDDHSDVATLIGYASRKLGRYDDARHWYAKALVSNPRNELTLSYLGMWHAEQGNRLKAQDYLAKVRDICGNTTCRAYAELKAVIAGTGKY